MKKLKFITICGILILSINQALAWDGYDYENKSDIEINEGNLVREGSVIQFYESKIDNYRTAKVISMDSVAGGVKLQVKDLDSEAERTFIMKEE